MSRRRASGHRRHGPRRSRGTGSPPPPVVPYSRLLTCLKRAAEAVTVPGLARTMALDSAQEGPLRRQLEYLEKQQIVFSQRRGRWSLHARARFVIGRFVSPEGTYGFVSPEEGSRRDLYVPGRRTGGARHGDLVLARNTGGPGGRGGGEGEILAVLERRPPFVVGLFQKEGPGGIVTPRDDRLGGPIVVGSAPAGTLEPADGTVVWAEVTSPEDRYRPACGRILSVLGRPADPGVDESAVEKIHDLPGAFPPDAEREARSHPRTIEATERSAREDFTGAMVVTVDPATARDHDDAVGLERIQTPRGEVWRLAVHIADVAHHVPEGGAVDREALRRGTSVYFPGRSIPMLPETLSSGLCSLLPGEDRLVQSVLLDFDSQGRRIAHRFADGVIRSAAKMTYEELGGILERAEEEGEEDGRGHVTMLREMGRLHRLLRSRRMRRGSLDLEIPETQVVVDPAGRPVDIRIAPHGPAEQVIEEFMLAANETVAEELRRRLPVSLYRVHEDPDPAEIDKVEEELAAAGLPVRRTRGAPASRIAAILAPFRGRREEQAVSMMVLRSLKLARYSHEAAGHFGLAAPLYTHFTSPIRRYPDLVVHRLLRATRSGAPARPQDPERLATLALECSRLERRAEEAERAVVDWKKAVYMSAHVGEEYHGMVTGATAAALYVTLEGIGVEGIVPNESGRERREDVRTRPSARHAPRRLGDLLRVRVQAVDTFRARILLKPLSTG